MSHGEGRQKIKVLRKQNATNIAKKTATREQMKRTAPGSFGASKLGKVAKKSLTDIDIGIGIGRSLLKAVSFFKLLHQLL